MWESFVMEIWASFLFFTITLHVTNEDTTYSKDRMITNVLVAMANTAGIIWAEKISGGVLNPASATNYIL